jgi:hypothetical protein
MGRIRQPGELQARPVVLVRTPGVVRWLTISRQSAETWAIQRGTSHNVPVGPWAAAGSYHGTATSPEGTRR